MSIFIFLGLLVFALLSYKRQTWGLYLILFLLPTYLIRFKIGFVPFTFLEGMILILAAVWLFRKIKAKKLFSTLLTLNHRLSSFRWPIFLFFIAAVISVFVSPNKLSALGDFRAFFVEPLIFFVIFLDLVQKDKEKNGVFYSLFGGALCVSLFTLYQIQSGFLVPANYLKEGRMTSFYGYPAAVGLFLAPVLAMAIGLFIEKIKTKNLKNIFAFFLLPTAFLFALALLATKTEGAFLGVVAATFLILMLTPWRKLAIVITLFITIIVLLFPASQKYVIQKATFSDVSGDVRLVLWQGTFKALKTNPVFGGGLSGFPKLYEKYREPKHVELLKYPHNIVLNFWTEMGILGLLSFLWLIFEFFRKVYKLKTISYKLAIFAAMLALVIYGLLDVPYFKNDLSVLFWVLIGLALI